MQQSDYLQELGEMVEELTREEQLIFFREQGDYLEPLESECKTNDHLVPGCASATYVLCRVGDGGTLEFQGDSESLISKGYVYILTSAFNGCTLEYLLKDAEPLVNDFAEKAQMKMSLIPSRANAFQNIFHFMKRRAVEAMS